MSDTVTFKTVGENPKNHFTLTVKKEFLNSCPEPEKFNLLKLKIEHQFITFLHNENGPAVIREADGKITEEYWVDGICLNVENPELAERIKHKSGFNTKFDELIK